ncbi:MAG: FAD:protein FMN transferase [Eubacteriales bacterium]|nr:FAD:protein FMN transferase [Eubacteriales bacterium]
MTSKKILPLLGLTGILFACTGCVSAPKEELYEKNLIYFDTVISLQFYAGENGDELMDHCVRMCQNYEHIFSRTDNSSELYKINHRAGKSIAVSDEIADLISVGLEYYQISEGMFDITVAPLSDLWDFKSENPVLPLEADIQTALTSVDASRISLEGNILTFEDDNTMIDLGALVKGYAADNMKKYLTENGVTSGNLNLGGNVLTIGTKPDGSNWRIGIQKPFDDRGTLAEIVEVSDKTVVSSGIYERYFEKDGTVYHHILSPDTGYPVENDIWEVSIICDSSLTGDALSTTCLTLGYEKARKLIDSLKDVEAIFILQNYEIHKTFS